MSEWTALAERSRNVFSTPEFAEVWLRHHDVETRIEDDGRSLVPLCVERKGPLRVLRFVGHGPADELGPLGEDPVDALRSALARGGWDVFAGEHLSARRAWAIDGARVVSRDESRVLHFQDTDWERYLASRSANFRSTLRRGERKLAQHVVREDLTPQGFETLLALHRERWGGAETGFTMHADFHRDFFRVAVERGWARLFVVDVEGEPAAAWYGFRFAGVESYYNAGRSLNHEKLGLGLPLIAHTIRLAQEDGLDEYRFLRGDEDFKRRFTDDDDGVMTLATARGALGRAALAALLGLRGAATRLRRSSPPAPRAAASPPGA